VRFPHHTKIFRGQIDAAPFVGVFFLLVIFMLLQSSFVFIPGLPIQLPEADNLPGTDNPTLAMAVDGSGNFYFENQLCDANRLRDQLRAAVAGSHEPVTLVVQLHHETKVDVFLRLAILARSVGIREVLQAVRPSIVPQPRPQAESPPRSERSP
jgi:biopolymer transport protein ExbD